MWAGVGNTRFLQSYDRGSEYDARQVATRLDDAVTLCVSLLSGGSLPWRQRHYGNHHEQRVGLSLILACESGSARLGRSIDTCTIYGRSI